MNLGARTSPQESASSLLASPTSMQEACTMASRRWVVRRVSGNGPGVWWIYFFGGRLTLFKYSFGGKFRWFSIYVTTTRFNLNWRVIGS